MRAILALSLVFLLAPTTSLADSPRPNEPVVAAGDDGTCYAKSVQAEIIGQRSTTTIYNVRASKNIPVSMYSWYSPRIYLSCSAWRNGRSETTVVRLGPWADGHRANKADLAVAFYLNGKLLKQYSTLDIAGTPSNVSGSVSHYSVFSSVDGFQWQDDGKLDFVANRVDGTRMRFASDTGQLVRKKP